MQNKTQSIIKGILIALILLVGVFSFFIIRISLRPEIDEDFRKNMKTGSFIKLKAGYTYYNVYGDENSEVVALLHGGSVPSMIWKENVQAIKNAGFKVITYDMYGRGYSDRPRNAYDTDSYVEQLHELLTKLDITNKVHLAGLSMGGAVLVSYYKKYPNKVDKMILVDPAGYYMSFLKDKSFDDIAKTLNYTPSEKVKELLARARKTQKFKGTRRAFFEGAISRNSSKTKGAFEAVGKSDNEVLLIWGKDDPVISSQYATEVTNVIPQATLHLIEKGGHIPNFEKPEVVNTIITNFLLQ